MEDRRSVLGSLDERGEFRLYWSVVLVSAVMVGASLVGLVRGTAGWPVIPMLIGGPVATVLVVRGRRAGRIGLSMAAFGVLLGTVVLTALLFKLG